MGGVFARSRAFAARPRPGQALYYIDSVRQAGDSGERRRFVVRALHVSGDDPRSDLPDQPHYFSVMPERVTRLGRPYPEECPGEGHWVWMSWPTMPICWVSGKRPG